MSYYLITCDIDGAGKKPRLATYRENEWGEPEVYFIGEDFGETMTIEEYQEEFPKNKVTKIDLQDMLKANYYRKALELIVQKCVEDPETAKFANEVLHGNWVDQ